MKRYLVIGADGQLGFDLMRVLGDKAVGLTHRDVDITDQQSVWNILEEHKPDIVINVAAISNAEQCEKEPDLCFSVNAMGAWNVAKAAAAIGCPVLLMSTDYVFDGSKDGFQEDDATHPLNVYGASKAAGEHLVQIANPQHYIIRSSAFFGVQLSHKGHDFPRLMLRLAKEQPDVRVVNDQFISPTYTKDLASKIKELIELEVPYGIYHVTNQGSCSWYELAKKVFEISGTNIQLLPIPTSQSPSEIKRPRNSVLKNTKFQELNIEFLRSWEEALEEYFKEIQTKPS